MTSTLIIRVPDPKNTPFKALDVHHNDKEILSVHYLTTLEETTSPLNGFPKSIADALCGYLDKAGPRYFDHLDLAPEQGCGINLSPDECDKVFEKIRNTDCGNLCAYGEIGVTVDWDNRDAVERKYSWAYAPIAKAVADACTANPFGIIVPCYRMVSVNKDKTGLCLGKFSKGHKHVDEKTGLAIKRWLIEHEGKWKVRAASDNSDLTPESELYRV